MPLTRRDRARILAALECMRGSGDKRNDRANEALIRKLSAEWGFQYDPPVGDA